MMDFFKLGVLLLCVAGFAMKSVVADDQFFEQEVAPILQQRCLSCHNENESKGDFSLHSAARALEDDYIVAGDAAGSHLLQVVTPDDGKAEMPKDGSPLTAEQIAVLTKWIDQGADWPTDFVLTEAVVSDFDWWSYRPLQSVAVPTFDDPESRFWVKTPVDAFVLRQLQQRGLTASPPADRRTLIRRLSYDLIGLPPTPAEVQAFCESDDPAAYEKLVDRLLESKHYGERWARHWLDVVKYADTCGYDKDKLRHNAWPYRDYVIRSLNQDKPYGQFIQEQIAGDALFPGQPDGIIGLGFLAAGPWDFIGHVEVSEAKIDGKVARNLDRDDMVCNTINTFCSITIQCARCHNHKFDPITQEHYYSLQSVFASVDRAERAYDLDPQIEQQRRDLEAQLAKLTKQQKQLEADIKSLGGNRLQELTTTVASLQSQQAVQKGVQFGYHSTITNKQNTEKWVEVVLPAPQTVGKIVLRPCHDDYADIGSGFGFPIRYRVEMTADETDHETTQWLMVTNRSESDQPNPALGPVVLTCDSLPHPVRRIRVTATRLAERRNDYIFALSELQAYQDSDAAIDSHEGNLAQGAKVRSSDSIQAAPRWGRKNLVDGHWPSAGDSDVQQALAEAIAERDQLLAKIETKARVAKRDQLKAAIKNARENLDKLPRGKMVYAAATHFKAQGNFKPTNGTPRPIHVLLRGDVQQQGTPVAPGVLPFSSTDPWQYNDLPDEAARRVAVARWLTHEDHPLVWRSIVNRIWQYHFGKGIVETPNDFGRMGAEPTHPLLLDYLARYFLEHGQSMKSLHRMIVTSNTYQQSSAHREAMAQQDQSNRYLWRMNRRRLSAEEIRDSIFVASGSLNRSMGGPGYYLFALEKTAHSPHYEYHKFDPADKTTHRRSIYRFIARSQPDPWMTTLDCADSSQSTPRRNETLTALQALSLLNNRFNLYMAQQMAKKVASDAADLPSQVDLAYLQIAQRQPDLESRQEMIAYAREHGLANLCRYLFNFSEFVYLD